MVEQTKQATQTTGTTVRKRVPLGTRNILTAPCKSGFVRRFVNDESDRVQAFKDAGYTLVDDPAVSVGDPKIGRPSDLGSVIRPSVGGGTKAVLMEIPQEFYDQDQALKQEKIKAVEAEMQRNKNKSYNDGLSGTVSIS